MNKMKNNNRDVCELVKTCDFLNSLSSWGKAKQYDSVCSDEFKRCNIYKFQKEIKSLSQNNLREKSGGSYIPNL